MIVRNIAGYLLIGVFFTLATTTLTAMGLGLEPIARLSPENPSIIQRIDRTHKGDRLDVHTTIDTRPVPKKRNGVPIGCEPVFSVLSSFPHSNISGHCVT